MKYRRYKCWYCRYQLIVLMTWIPRKRYAQSKPRHGRITKYRLAIPQNTRFRSWGEWKRFRAMASTNCLSFEGETQLPKLDCQTYLFRNRQLCFSLAAAPALSWLLCRLSSSADVSRTRSETWPPWAPPLWPGSWWRRCATSSSSPAGTRPSW